MRLKRPSPALVIATVALVAASGGSAVGASYITGKQIKNGSITGADIKNHSITKSDVRGVAGPRGPQGPQGAIGPPGPTSSASQSIGHLTRVEFDGSVAPGDTNGVSVACPPGMGIVSGGALTAGAGVIFAEDSFGQPGWSVLYDNYYGSTAANVSAVAYCAPTGQAVAARAHHMKVPAALMRALARERALHHR